MIALKINHDNTCLKPLLNVETRKLLLVPRLSIRGCSDTDKLLWRLQPFLVRSYIHTVKLGWSWQQKNNDRFLLKAKAV